MDWAIKTNDEEIEITIEIPLWEMDYLKKEETKAYFPAYFSGECKNIFNTIVENINKKENK